MKWNAFDLVSVSISKTKERLFPFQFKEWLKLLVITILSSWAGINTGSANFNYSSNSQLTGELVGELGAKAKTFFREHLGFIGIMVLLISALGTLLTYIGSVFSFVLLEALLNKKSEFSFRKNHAKGFSLFWFLLLVDVLTIAVLGALAYPYLHILFLGGALSAISTGYIVFSITAAVAYILLLWIVLLFFNDFVIPFMYMNDVSALYALKQVWSYILKNKAATLVYFLSRLALNLGIAIVGVLIALASLIALLIAGAVVFGIGFLLHKIIGLNLVFAILAAVVGVVFLLVFILGVSMLSLPLSVFGKYFSLFNFEKLMDANIFKYKPKIAKLKPWSTAKKVIAVGLLIILVLAMLFGILGYGVWYAATNLETNSTSDEVFLGDSELQDAATLTEDSSPESVVE